MTRKTLGATAIAAIVLCSTQAAFAHPGHDHGSGLSAGILHPLTGIDHILAMVAVGLWAAQLGGRAIWLLPATFLSLMIGGGALAYAGVPVPHVEQGIMASVLILGLLIAVAARLPLLAAAPLVGLFAVCHGYAHVAEMNAGLTPAAYATGFIFATAMLHAAGIGIGLTLKRLPLVGLPQIAGAGIAVAGVMLFFGLI